MCTVKLKHSKYAFDMTKHHIKVFQTCDLAFEAFLKKFDDDYRNNSIHLDTIMGYILWIWHDILVEHERRALHLNNPYAKCIDSWMTGPRHNNFFTFFKLKLQQNIERISTHLTLRCCH